MANATEIYKLIEKLCVSIGGEQHKKEILKEATNFLAGCPISLSKNYDSGVVSKIWNKLSSAKSTSDAAQFLVLHEKLMEQMDPEKCRNILTVMFHLADSSSSMQKNTENILISPFGEINSNISNMKTSLMHLYDSNQKLLHDQSRPNSTKNITSKLPSASSFDSAFENGSVSKTSITTNATYQSSSSSSSETVDLEQEVLYALVGVQGKILRKNVVTGEFKVDTKHNKYLRQSEIHLMLRIARVGFFHDKIKKYTNPNSGCYLRGLMGQGLVSALEKELSNYYAMVALLQEQLNCQKQSLDIPEEPLTLLRIMTWIVEPLNRLQWLADIANVCSKDMKGGRIASSVFQFIHNGNPTVRSMVKELLVHCCKPLQQMLVRWLLDGEIEDPYDEFFIEELPDIELDRLWHEKYRIQTSRLPAFISPEIANKIFVTGKSINFLREVCEDRAPIKDAEEIRSVVMNNIDCLFEPVDDTKLHQIINQAYLNTSKAVLDNILVHHKMIENLQALKNYLLLGQGDFIGLLMQNLKHELDRPAKNLFRHDLHAIMCTALRSSCAQFDEPDVLDNLDVHLMEPFDGDTGWDTFTLHYSVQGPLATMLRPSMDEYRIIFKPLWNIKRIEFVLLKVWKEQLLNSKCLKRSGVASEIKGIASRLHLCTSEMIHFIHQMQYYTMFEVIECQWNDLIKNIQQANALDDVLESHNQFLETIKMEIFLDETSNHLYVAMEAIFNSIMKLEKWQDEFYINCLKEAEARRKMEENVKRSERTGKYGVTTTERFERDQEKKIFEGKLFTQQKALENISNEYARYTREFIYKLAATQEHSLQLFGIRLDFNEFYKKNDFTLNAPLTFEHVRQSSMFHNSTLSPIELRRKSSAAFFKGTNFTNSPK